MLPARLAGAALGLAALAFAPRAGAFCGFYVAGGGARLFNDATQVVLMRDDQRTVLSMQNDYRGPPERFAMVVPVPVVLQKENVKTLTRAVFEHVDQLTAPRLVEYWERDPCAKSGYEYQFSDDPLAAGGYGPSDATIRVRPGPVRVEARFAVGEYDVVILGADDSSALDRWLHDNGYAIPDGAEPLLRPYVQHGMKFFVAKVDVSKVKLEAGHAALSPLRFHYDTAELELPVRLGLLNSSGTQDLIVNVLARRQRFEIANYDNVTIPTNLGVQGETRAQFGAFYTSLFDATVRSRPRAVVTEYAWDAASCDPCPTPPLDDADLDALGADVLGPPPSGSGPGFVVTRLHARYGKDALGDDLRFRAASPITGGRGVPGRFGELGEKVPAPAESNAFQARYVIRNAWTGPIACSDPVRGVWGGPASSETPGPLAATQLAFARRGASLANFLAEPLPPTLASSLGGPWGPPAVPKRGGCAGCVAGGGVEGSLWLAAIGAALAALRRAARARGR